jgi:hypothetical protein
MPQPMTLGQLRRVTHNTWEEIEPWLLGRPALFDAPNPAQQILFEYASRLRDTLRSLTANPSWDGLHFDASLATATTLSLAEAAGRRPPIYLDTRELFGLHRQQRRAEAPDVACAVCVLRACDEILDMDEDCRPRHQAWMPVSIRAQGRVLEEQVRQFEEISRSACDGYLFIVYSNAAGRATAVDQRDVASWASWRQPTRTLWWASRHFRAKAAR